MNEFLYYAFSVCGAILSDTYLGLFKTLILMLFICIFGTITVTLASINFQFLPIFTTSLLGLTIAMIGMGCLRMNQNVFGGSQFELPRQTELFQNFISVNFSLQKCGQVCGIVLFPILYNEVKCFGEKDCYPLAFGVTTFLIILSSIIFVSGKKFYVHVPPCGNVMISLIKCIHVSFF
jgi:solute carrier family 15 (oligopeptide transporter), member 1